MPVSTDPTVLGCEAHRTVPITLVRADGDGRVIGYSRSILTTLPTCDLDFWFHENDDTVRPLTERRALTYALAELGPGDTLLIESVDRLTSDRGQFAALCTALRAKGAGLAAHD